MLEKEYKIILDITEYEYILDLYDWNEKYIQVNHYYDTEKFDLDKNGYSFKIRFLDNKLLIIIKCDDVSKNNLYKSKNEFIYKTDSVPECVKVSFFFELSTKFAGNLHLLGQLTTERNVFYLEDDTTIFLDKNQYLGEIDYELEVEFKNNDYVAMDILKNMHLIERCEIKTKGKYSRFLKAFLDG